MMGTVNAIIIAQLLVILTVLSTHASQEIKGTVTCRLLVMTGMCMLKTINVSHTTNKSIPAEQTI